jgi:hypothetical protein
MPAASPVTIHNEQVKLFASSLERAGTSAITVGVFAPLAAALFKLEGFNQELLPTIMGVVCWALLAAFLYIESQRALRRLAQ